VALDSKKVCVVLELVNQQFQNLVLNYLFELTRASDAIVIVCNILTSFNMMSVIQMLLLQSGKYKLYLFLLYVLMC
jgi:hypothetical protein